MQTNDSIPIILGQLVDQLVIQNSATLTLWLLCFPAAWLISVILSSFGRFYCSIITQKVRKISKEIIFKHIVNLPSSVYITRDSGEVENLMQELSFNARFIFNENLPFFMRTSITLLIAMILLWMISSGLAVLFFIWLILYIPISYLSAKKSVKDVSNSILSASKVSASTVEVVQNHELIPAFGTEAFEIDRFANLLEGEEQAFNKAQKKIDLCDLWQRVLQVILPLGFVIYLIFFEGLLDFSPGD
jgi:ABC-type bacteriocin/lantibiotic exporter with double-glycine peptidase domain